MSSNLTNIYDSSRCGIILAGGKGTRLAPMTTAVSKQLLPIYDKPMIYYPMSLLMLAKIRDVLIISDPISLPLYERLFGDGNQFGMKISYAIQEEANGLAQAFVIGREFIRDRNVCLVLGDNIFYGTTLTQLLQDADENPDPTVFAYYVKNPQAYGVVEFDEDTGTALSLEEKPANPKSNFAVPGIYFYPNNVIDIAANLKPSARGEYEITDVNKHYLEQKVLNVQKMSRGIAWLDSGTPASLNDASNFVRTIQERTGLKVADLNEIAEMNSWIDSKS